MSDDDFTQFKKDAGVFLAVFGWLGGMIFTVLFFQFYLPKNAEGNSELIMGYSISLFGSAITWIIASLGSFLLREWLYKIVPYIAYVMTVLAFIGAALILLPGN